jgi:hypothetical protein
MFIFGVRNPWEWHRRADTCRINKKTTLFHKFINCALTWFYKRQISKIHGMNNFKIGTYILFLFKTFVPF